MIQEEEMHFVWTSVTHDPHLKQCEYGRFRGGNGRRRGRGVKRLNCKSVYWKWNGRGVMELLWKKGDDEIEWRMNLEGKLPCLWRDRQWKKRIVLMEWIINECTLFYEESYDLVLKKTIWMQKPNIYDWRSLNESSYYSKNSWKGRVYSERFHSTYKVLSSNFTLILISSLWVWFNSIQNNGS